MINIDHSLRAKRLNGYKSGIRPLVRAIVLHDTAGSGTIGDAKYLANDPENRKVSVDFVILRDGTIYQLNPDLTKYSTNHAGRHTRLAIPGTNEAYTNADVNEHTIGIELSHHVVPSKQHPEWPIDQINSAALLCKDLCSQFNLKTENITTHAKIITDRTRTDPRNFDWVSFWSCFNCDGLAITPKTGNPVPDTHIFHIVVSGDTLSGLASQYHTSIEAIKVLNHYDSPSTLINVGQRLLVKE